MERVDSIFQILDTSTICKGVQVKDGEVLNSVILHQSGLYNDGLIEEKEHFPTSAPYFAVQKSSVVTNAKK